MISLAQKSCLLFQMKKLVKVSDYVINFVASQGVKHIFLISGGGNIHLIDSVGRNRKINYICNHHEQASATAAEAYTKVTGNLGVSLVTTGPGGTNAITGVAGAWLDSIPTLTISGQVRTDISAEGTKLRQLGDQELNIIDIVKPITKYAVIVKNPMEVLYHLEKAIYLAKVQRPGPVWLDIPLDVQGSFVEPSKLQGFNLKEVGTVSKSDKKNLKKLVAATIDKLRKSQRPVLYAGNGIRLAGAADRFLKLVDLLKIPVLTSYAGYDLIYSSHPLYFGRAHAFGQRAANFIIQNSDFLLSIGARLDLRTIGFTFKAFARAAYKVIVDIDKNELTKKTLDIDLPVNFDASEFIDEMMSQLRAKPLKLRINDWFSYGVHLNKKYPPVLSEFRKEKKYVNPYFFIETIGKYLKPKELIVLSDGIGPLNCSYQVLYIKPGQRVILNNGFAQMGYGLPAAIGVCFASGKKRVVCFEGDGSVQLNIHELQIVKYYNLPIKLFVYSNDGYLSIRNTQKNLFGGRFVASDTKSGLSCPDILKVAKAYGLPTLRINNHKDMKRKIKKVLETKGPIVCDINSTRDLMLTPKLTTKKTPEGRFVSPPLEEMSPLLPEEEFKNNMIIPLWKEN